MMGPHAGEPLPVRAVVGQDEAKLALMLAAVEPAIGGVLLRRQKGSAKATLDRGLARLLTVRTGSRRGPPGRHRDLPGGGCQRLPRAR